MLYIFIIVYMLLLPITIITFLWKILDKVEDKKVEPQENKKVRRHITVGESAFENVFGGRKAYEIYKNKDGLYEPITPSRGIQIKKTEE